MRAWISSVSFVRASGLAASPERISSPVASSSTTRSVDGNAPHNSRYWVRAFPFRTVRRGRLCAGGDTSPTSAHERDTVPTGSPSTNGICAALGASYAGSLAVTTTSGPGLALKGEALGLAVMTELPLVVIDVQRGGPSTGLPTKSEQTDLNQALYGRNGESPVVVIAALSPTDCFDSAFWASKLALEHMTPVVLLTDGYIANGSSSWKIPSMSDYPEIKPNYV